MTALSGTSKPIPFEEFCVEMERRCKAAGYPEVPRNAGNRRTESKRAFLKAIADAGGKW